MNAYQQTLNLTDMNTTKQTRVSFAQTSKRWTNFLNELKSDLENDSVSGLTAYMRKYRVSNSWAPFLKMNNIVYTNLSGYYKWNNKIPVSKKLIAAFRTYQAEQNQKYYTEEYIKINSIERKKPVNKQKVDVTKLKTYRPNQENKVGLIRKFIKWIY